MSVDEFVSLREAERRERSGWQAPNPGYRPPRLDIIDPGKWQGKEPPLRPWLVPGWIPREEVTLLYGVGGAGKSILSLQLMVSAALGFPWAGQPVERTKCLYFSCEDNSNEIWRRLAKILPAYDVDFADISGMVGVIDRAREPDNALMGYTPPESGYGRGPFETTTMYQSLYREAVEFGAGLVVIDSLYNAFAGYENSRAEANSFLNYLARLAMDLNGGQGGAIVVLAHPSRAGRETGEGGVTAWSDACRSRLQFRRPEIAVGEPEDNDARELICRKMNFGPDGEVLDLRWNDGVFVPESKGCGGLVDTLDRNNRARGAEVAFLSGLDALASQGRRTNVNKNQVNYAPKLMLGLSCCAGFKKHELERAMNRLFDQGLIRVEEEGPKSRRRSHIARAENERAKQ
jgi:RecA-family ATPase